MPQHTLTGKPSVDRPWLKYYPAALIEHLRIPECTLRDYLEECSPGLQETALHYYGEDITWQHLFGQADAAARALKAVGFGEGDQIPVFLRAVPEFIYLLLAAEKIGASLLCRDNTLEENVHAVSLSGAPVMLAHDFLTQEELDAYLDGTQVRKAVLLDPCLSGSRDKMPDYIQESLDSNYTGSKASGPAVISWQEFLALGQAYTGEVEAPKDIDRPLFRAYTSGSTGPSKQVIHSAHTMIGVVHQLNFYGSGSGFRPTCLVTILPVSLVAMVVSMILMPLASNKLLILDPFCDAHDVDLEVMRYRPNLWITIPMFLEMLVGNGRVPDDYDMSYMLANGAGCEALNNRQRRRAQQFYDAHNCHFTFSSGYGSSEVGSAVTLPCRDEPNNNGSVGIPMPLTNVSIFKKGTTKELTYNELGEICVCSPGNMLGYDSEEATAKTLIRHEDGQVWLHTGDTGYINENGVLFMLTRGKSPRYGGGFLDMLPMENLVADAEIPGIIDEFFVLVPDQEHEGYFLPYLYVVLEEGYTVEDIRDQVDEVLEPHMRPVDVISIPGRPFFHFKTNRVGLVQEMLSAQVCAK